MSKASSGDLTMLLSCCGTQFPNANFSCFNMKAQIGHLYGSQMIVSQSPNILHQLHVIWKYDQIMIFDLLMSGGIIISK